MGLVAIVITLSHLELLDAELCRMPMWMSRGILLAMLLTHPKICQVLGLPKYGVRDCPWQSKVFRVQRAKEATQTLGIQNMYSDSK